MGRLFKKHPLTVLKANRADQHVLDVGERSYDRLRRVCSHDIDKTTDELSAGAVTIENYRSTEFGPANVEFGENVAFSVRVDERKAPAAAVKKAFDDALDLELQTVKAHGKNFVSRARKLEIKEQIKLRMTANMPPVPKVVDVFWNTQAGLVFITDKSPKMVAHVQRVIEGAFSPEFQFEQVAMDIDMVAKCAILNGVWQERDLGGKHIFFSDREYIANIEDKVTISDRYEEVSGCGHEEGAGLEEIAEGIRQGKRITKALLRFDGPAIGFDAEVSAESMPNILSLSIPTVTHHDEEEFSGALMGQMGNVEEAFGVLCAMIVQTSMVFETAA